MRRAHTHKTQSERDEDKDTHVHSESGREVLMSSTVEGFAHDGSAQGRGRRYAKADNGSTEA